jgi:hypothetical protein
MPFYWIWFTRRPTKLLWYGEPSLIFLLFSGVSYCITSLGLVTWAYIRASSSVYFSILFYIMVRQAVLD